MRLSLLLFALFLCGCSHIQSVDKVIVSQPGERWGFGNNEERDLIDVKMIETGEYVLPHAFSRDALLGLAQYALLADAAYEQRGSLKRSTIRPQPTKRDPSYKGLPETIGGVCHFQSRYTDGWRNMRELSSEQTVDQIDVGQFRIKTRGFKYQVWHDENQTEDRKKVVIVFRGTTNHPGNWYSNFRIFTRFLYFGADHYEQTGHLLKLLLPKIMDEFGNDAEIIAVGHSLGGGLAQNIAYLSPDIEKAYVFANSPVTGLTAIDRGILPTLFGGKDRKDRRKTLKDNREKLRIIKVSETGEWLATARFAFNQLGFLANLSGAKIAELRFNFRRPLDDRPPNVSDSGQAGGGGFLGQHSITQFACDLICRLEKRRTHEQCIEIPHTLPDGRRYDEKRS